MHMYEHALCMHADRRSSPVVDSRRQKDPTTSTTSTAVQLRAKGLYLAPAWLQAAFFFCKRQKPIANSQTWRFFRVRPRPQRQLFFVPTKCSCMPGFQFMACVHACVPIWSSKSRQLFPKSTAKSSKVGISEFVAPRRCDHRFWRTLLARVYQFL